MSNKMTWLLAGAAMTLFAGAGVAIAHEPDAKDKAERRVERDVRVHRFADGGHAHRVFVRRSHDRGERLKDILQLRPDQEPALNAFLEATRRERGEHRMVKFDRDTSKPTLERLAEMEAHMAEQQREMTARIDATRAFYNQLDAAQRKAFDAMPMMMMAGPHIGPMMIPRVMPIAHVMPAPPAPPVPPPPPAPPSDL